MLQRVRNFAGFSGPSTHYSRAQSTIRREYRRLYDLVSIGIAGLRRAASTKLHRERKKTNPRTNEGLFDLLASPTRAVNAAPVHTNYSSCLTNCPGSRTTSSRRISLPSPSSTSRTGKPFTSYFSMNAGASGDS